MTLLDKIFLHFARTYKLAWMPDRSYLKMMYHASMGKKLNLKDPKTFNEKLQWLKLYDRKKNYTKLVDKYEAKNVVAELIGKEYIIPTLGVWDSFDMIDFVSLPDKFVLKTTHDSGGVFLCNNKERFNINEARLKMEYSMKRHFYDWGREWPYKNVQPRIIAEEYLSNNDENGLVDYKIHCFHGTPKFILVCKNRFSEMTEDFYTVNWKHISVCRRSHPNSKEPITRPELLKEMVELSKVLSKDIPFLRTDFYSVSGKLYFGEMTFFPASGFEPFIPERFDFLFGKWINLPKNN